jgi:hypothetical protein
MPGGPKKIVPVNRARPCKLTLCQEIEGSIVKLAPGKYREFNDLHLTNKLGKATTYRL